METLWDVPFRAVNVTSLGSPASRKRLFGTNIVDISALVCHPRRSGPNQFLRDPAVFCSGVYFPCLVASDPDTKNPIKLHFVDQSASFRHLTPGEAEALHGWPNGIINGRQIARVARFADGLDGTP